MDSVRPGLSRLLSALGRGLVVLALFFVFAVLWSHRDQLRGWHPTPLMGGVVLGGAIVYAANCFLLSTAWWRLLVWYGQADAPLKLCHVIYARSQIAKYIPGNIFHLTGRHLLGVRVGFNQRFLVGASLHEFAGVIVAFSIIALCGLPLFSSSPVLTLAPRIVMVFAVALLAPFVLRLFAAWIPLRRTASLREKDWATSLAKLTPTYCLYIVFCLVAGGVFVGIAASVVGINGLRQGLVFLSVFAASWIAGFVTPGAPGGIGIREAVLVASLGREIGQTQGLVAAGLFRLVTVLGDVLFFAASYLFCVRKRLVSGVIDARDQALQVVRPENVPGRPH